MENILHLTLNMLTGKRINSAAKILLEEKTRPLWDSNLRPYIEDFAKVSRVVYTNLFQLVCGGRFSPL